MANVNINNNYGNVTVADTIYQCSRPEDQEMNDWLMEFYPALFAGHESPEQEQRRLEAEAEKAELDKRDHAIDELISVVTMLAQSIEALRGEVTRNA